MPGIQRRQAGDALPGVASGAWRRCVLVGEGTLPLQCADLLLASGHEVVALAMPTDDAHAWATTHGIPLIAPTDDLAGALASCPFDYLFSVVNPRVLPTGVLGLAGRGAINYHDSLLPRYAGVHATSWAMIAGEREHGVTWHEMDAGLDHGRILAQESVTIETTDTALTLNAKCYEAAIRTFRRLVDSLGADERPGTPQDLTQRSYFAKHTRPPAACAIDWTQPAASIDAFTRALIFGDFPNALGTPKLFIGGRAFTCARVHALDDTSHDEPGVVLRADADGIVVGTGRGSALIPSLMTLEGDAVSVVDLVQARQVAVGDVLSLARSARDELTKRDGEAARGEKTWIGRLLDLRPPILPAIATGAAPRADVARRSIAVRVPNRVAALESAARDAALCAAFTTLLARLVDADEIDVGVTRECESGASDATGIFATQFPWRVIVDRSVAYDAFVGQLRASLADLATCPPLALDVWSRMPALRTGDAYRWRHGLPVGIALGCDADVRTRGEVLTLALHRNGDVAIQTRDGVAASAAAELVHQLEVLLADASSRADAPVGDLHLLDDREMQRVLHEWNDTEAPAGIVFVHRAFAERARRNPNAIASTYEGTDLTYGELEARANQLAWELRERGVARDTRVCVCVPRSHEMLIALLGVLKAGGAYVPLMPEHPAARTDAILTDAEPRVIVVASELRERFAVRAGDVVVLDDASASLARHPRNVAPESDESPTSAAYVMYTSGSTGRPKGVIVPHRALGNLADWVGRLVPLTDADSMVHKTPLAFDPSGLEIFSALTTGARLVLARPDGHQDLAYVLDLMQRERVTAAVFIPSVLAASVDLPGFASACRALRLVIIGGEALNAELVAHLHAASPVVEVFNLYGPTEATIACTGWRAPRDVGARGPLPIGTPVANVRAYVLDRRLNPVPPGVEGELCIGGIQVASGYLRRPELTDDRFARDRFSADSRARLYRTGDRARWRRDGVLEFRGRFDDQLKVRGFRVEPGEIEHAIRACPGVRECLVVAAGSAEHAQLVAYVVAGGGASVDASSLAAFARGQLPSHMVPAAFVLLDALPLTANGKVDLRALPRADVADDAGNERTAPRSQTERAVSAIWSEVLGRPVTGVEDDFFARGGNSLLATRVLARVHERFGVELPLRAMFDATNVERFSAVVDTACAGASFTGATPHTHAGTTPDVAAPDAPLSFAQELLWMLDRTRPGLWAYNLWDASRISGPCDEHALAAALNELAARHPALRTSFVNGADGVAQHVADSVVVPFAVLDLRAHDGGDRDAAARRTIVNEIQRPFDLGTAPLARAALVRVADDVALFVVVFHHLVADGRSRDVLLRELGMLYAARHGGEAVTLAPLQLDYATFARKQRAAWSGKHAAELLAYWTDELAGAPDLLELPTDHPRSSAATFDGATCDVTWPAALRDTLRATGERAGTTLFMTVVAGIEAVLARYSGQDDFVVGTPVLGRRARAAEDVVGYFAGLIPLRSDVVGDPTFEELLRRVRVRCVAALDHQDVPFGALVDALGRPADPAHSPVFQVMVAVEEQPRAPLALHGAVVSPESLEVGSAKYDLWITVHDTGDGLVASAEYRTDLFERATVERFLDHLGIMLDAAAAAPHARVSTLAMLTDADRVQLARWNATQTSTPTACVHELIDAQAYRSPDAVALVSGEGDLTYAQLQARSNRLARYLARSGVASGALVGVCMEPSPDLMVALIAVMKVGAAYVPLDPTYPADRLAFMVRDSGIRTLVTRAGMTSTVGAFGGTSVFVDRDAAAIAAESSSALDTRVSPEQRAYVIYTSGSTGVPKGAMLPHRAVANYLLWMRDAIAAGERDCVIQKAPVSFDASVWELYLPLISGGRVAIVQSDAQREPLLLLGSMATHGVTVVQFVPSLLSAVLDAPGFAVACRHVRLIVLGGEALPGDLVRRVRELLPHVELLNLYGPTEAAVYATAYRIPPSCSDAVVPIGRPIANVQVRVMSGTAAQTLPAGIAGELVIGGAGVGLGYHDRPELSAERFVPDAESARMGALMYRTGDRARWRRDGTLEFLGRLDDQVKIRGFRVELGEIEHVLATHQAVRDCAVVSRTMGAGGTRLVAYVVAHGSSLPRADELRRWIAARLPEHMVPAAFVAMDALPLGVTGKLDRRALPDPVIEATEYHAPRPGLEETVAATWRDAFSVERISRDDDFFHLGGHSLLAMRVVLRLGAQLQLQLPMRILFDGRTVAGVAHAIEREHPELHGTPSLAEMLAALDALSDDQAREMLTK